MWSRICKKPRSFRTRTSTELPRLMLVLVYPSLLLRSIVIVQLLLTWKRKRERVKLKVDVCITSFQKTLSTPSFLCILLSFVLSQNRVYIDRSLEMETWHDLADVYTRLSQWRDAEVCLLKSKVINPHSASRWHSTGTLYFLHYSCLLMSSMVCTSSLPMEDQFSITFWKFTFPLN